MCSNLNYFFLFQWLFILKHALEAQTVTKQNARTLHTELSAHLDIAHAAQEPMDIHYINKASVNITSIYIFDSNGQIKFELRS
ncbi:hypothetical protein AM593_04985, partial [Mytilus galloprovincialis]